MTDHNRRQGGAGALAQKSPTTTTRPRIITPDGHLDLGGGVHVTREEFCRLCELVRPAFLTEPRDEAAYAEFDEIVDRGIARAASTTTQDDAP